MNNNLMKRYADISFVLTIILQIFCYKNIHYSEILLIFSTIMFFACFLIITESIDNIFKRQNIMENFKSLLFALSAILFFITFCIFALFELKNGFVVFIISAVSFTVFRITSPSNK